MKQEKETRTIKSIKIGQRHRKDLGNLRGLADSMKRVGMLHPVVIDPANRLIAGRRRLEAAKLLGWPTVPVRVVNLDDVAEGELAENAHRKDFVPSELWAVAKAVMERVARPRGRPSKNGKVETFHHSKRGKTRDKAAAYFGVSGRHLEKIGAVVEAAEADPKRFGYLKEEMDRGPRHVHRCYQKLKALRQQEDAGRDKIEPVDAGTYTLRENEIVCGDCRDLLPRIKSNTFHAVITDPVFGIGLVYNGRREEADDPVSYWRWFEPVYREMHRVLKPGGFCAIFQAAKYMRYFWDWFAGEKFSVYAACCQPTRTQGGPAIVPCWNPVVVFYKGGRPKYRSPDFVRSRDWFVSNTVFDDLAKLHPCPEPLDQCEELVRSFTCEGALVLDCFCGVGGIPIACARLNRRYVGIEIDPEFVQIARTRMTLLGSDLTTT